MIKLENQRKNKKMTEERHIKPLEEQLLIEAEAVNLGFGNPKCPIEFHLIRGFHARGELGGVVPIGSPIIIKIFSDKYLDPDMIHADQLAILSRQEVEQLKEAINQSDSSGRYVQDKIQGAFVLGKPYSSIVQAPHGNVVIPTLCFPVQFYRFDLEQSSPAIKELPRFPGAVYFNRRTAE